MDNNDLRKKIIEINRSNLEPSEKSKLIFELMNNKKPEIKKKEIVCNHYKRNNNIVCPKCNNIYGCRFCHDENEDHQLDRFKIQKVQCKKCLIIQDKSNQCVHCDVKFAHYYCKICNLYDDDESKIINHCDKCGICRIGKIKHCDICNMCYNEDTFDNHNCQGKYDSICPICNEDLKTSRHRSFVLPCKHVIHSHCFEKNMQNGNYKCPLCNKSMANMQGLWNQIEHYVENSQMPEEFNNMYSNILCNDCLEKSVSKFHFMYHKCQHCNSWNTNVIDTFRKN